MESAALLETILNLSLEKESKFSLVDSIYINRLISSEHLGSRISKRKKTYSLLETQKYSENLVEEYIKKNKLAGRIIRLGEVYGPGVIEEESKVLNKMISQAIEADDITVIGEGLEEHYFVYITDAVFGLLKAQFADDVIGKTYALADPEEVTELSLAYTLIDLNYRADEVEFSVDDSSVVLDKDDTPNLSEIGWTPKVSLSRGIKQTADTIQSKSLPGVDTTKKPVEKKPTEKVNKKSAPEKTESQKVSPEETQTDTSSDTQKGTSIMDIFGKKNKTPVLEKNVPEEEKDNRMKRVTGLSKTKKKDKDIEKKAKHRSEIGTPKSKVKTGLKIGGVIVLIIAYFVLFAPVIKYFYNSFSLNQEYNKLSSKAFDQSLSDEEMLASLDKIDTYLANQNHSVNVPYVLGKLSNQDTFVNDIVRDLNNYEGMVSDLRDVILYKQAMSAYLSDLQFTASESGDSSSINQKGVYNSPKTNLSMPEAVDDLHARIELLSQDDFTLNKVVENFVQKEDLNKFTSDALQNYEIFTELFGINDKSVNLMMIVDDQTESAIGGDPIGFIRLEFEDSKLTNIKLSDYKTVAEYIDSSEFWKDLDSGEVSTEYLKTIPNQTSLFQTVSKSYEDYTKVKIDNMVIVNLTFLEGITDLNSKLEFNDEEITKSNLRSAITDAGFSDSGQFILASLFTFNNSKNSIFGERMQTAYEKGDVKLIRGSQIAKSTNSASATNSIDEINLKETRVASMEDVKLQREKKLDIKVDDELNAIGKYTLIYKYSDSENVDTTKETEQTDQETNSNEEDVADTPVDEEQFKEYVSFTLPENYKIKGMKGIQDLDVIDGNSISGLVTVEGQRYVVEIDFEFKVTKDLNNELSVLKQGEIDPEYLNVTLSSDSEKYKIQASGLVESDGIYSYTGAFPRNVDFSFTVK